MFDRGYQYANGDKGIIDSDMADPVSAEMDKLDRYGYLALLDLSIYVLNIIHPQYLHLY